MNDLSFLQESDLPRGVVFLGAFLCPCSRLLQWIIYNTVQESGSTHRTQAFAKVAKYQYVVILLSCVYILSVISPCTKGLKALYDPSDCTSTVQLSSY